MLCSHSYTYPIDVWSIGCTFAELLNKNYLFPGENYLNQIKIIIDTIGFPPNIEFITNQHAKNYVLSFKGVPKVGLFILEASSSGFQHK